MISFLLLLTLLTFGGQDPSPDNGPPGITIRKPKWEKVGPSPTVDASIKAESDSPNGSTSDSNVPAQASGVRERDTAFFVYSVELQNKGNKSIKAILWDYVLTDSGSREELGRHNFVSFEKIGSNSVKSLKVRSRFSPSRTVTVQDTPAPGNTSVLEKVVLRCVVYEDGTLWQQPGTNENCAELQKRASNRSAGR
jgi:hypothetical protein